MNMMRWGCLLSILLLVGCSPLSPSILPDTPVIMEYLVFPSHMAPAVGGVEHLLDAMALNGWTLREFVFFPVYQDMYIIWEKPRTAPPEAPDSDTSPTPPHPSEDDVSAWRVP